jgi:hypothetical protein
MQGRSSDFESQAVAVAEPVHRRVELVEKLESTRQDMHQFLLARCLARVAVVVLALAGLLAFADWLLVLPAAVRGGGLVVLAVLAATLVYRWALAPRRHFGKQDAASEVESNFPVLGQRVRTTLEYAEPTPATVPALPGLVDALLTETDQRTSGLNLREVIPWKSLRWIMGGLVGLLAIYVVLLAKYPELRKSVQRLLLLPVHYTELTVEPGNVTLKEGAELAVQATLTGRPVPAAELLYREAGGQDDWTRLALGPDPVPSDGLLGTLETKLGDSRKDLEYRVVAGRVESPLYRLTVLHPLHLKQVEATVAPPAYTRRPEAVVKEGNFQVIEGSTVRFRFGLDRAPQTAQLRVYPGAAKPADQPAQTIPLTIKDNELTGDLAAINKELDYELVASAADGMHLDAGRFRIRVQPDGKPTVRFVKPKEQIEVTPTTEVHMRLEAGDDFGLSKVGIVYQVGSGPKKTLYLKDHPDQPLSEQVEAVLGLEDEQVDFQSGVTYYAFAEDNHPTKPHRATTELQFIDIRPYKREFQLLKTGGS